MTTRMLPEFSCRDPVAVLINYNEDEAERRLVLCSAYLTPDSKNPPHSGEFEEVVRYCESENLYLVTGCHSSSQFTVGGSTNCNDRGVDLLESPNSSNMEILNQGNDPTYCSGKDRGD
jgi:hypothetical protein